MKVLAKNIALDTPQETEHIVEANDNMTIQELLDEANTGWADLSDYYPLSGVFAWNDAVLPYLFTDGKVSYDIAFENAKVKDFLSTHNICDNTIRVTTGYPWAGGPGFLELVQIWDNIYPYLEAIAVLVTITGVSLKELYSYLRKRFLKKEQPPQTCFDIVFSRRYWNASELAELLDIEQERAKELLKLLDYSYDRTQMQYIQGERTKEIKEQLMNAEVRDV